MSVEVMQWLKGEIEKDIPEAKRMTLDFVSKLNAEVLRLEAWVNELKNGDATKILKNPVPYDSGVTTSVAHETPLPFAAVPHTNIPDPGVPDATANAADAAKAIEDAQHPTGTYVKPNAEDNSTKTGEEAEAATKAATGGAIDTSDTETPAESTNAVETDSDKAAA